MTAKRYEIRTVLDFLKVPPKRRSACLREFATFLKISTPSLDLLNALGRDAGFDHDVAKLGETFTWVDDGARNIDVVIKAST